MKLSKPMRTVLKQILEGDGVKIPKQTKSGLIQRGLLSEACGLTNQGKRTAITLLPLTRQCSHMKIGFSETEIYSSKDQLEINALKYFTNDGHKGICGEGTPILLLIRAAILDLVDGYSTFETRTDNCRRCTEAHMQIHIDKAELIINTVKKVHKRVIRRNLKEILLVYEAHGPTHGLTVRNLLQLYDLIGSHKLAEISSALLEDPYGYRKGWPDLVMWKGKAIRWIEIKTTDKLHASQISTINRFQNVLPGTVEVVRVKLKERRPWFRRLLSS